MNNYKPWKNYSHDPKKSEFMNTYDNLSPQARNEVFTKAFWSGGNPDNVKPLTPETRAELSEARTELQKIREKREVKRGYAENYRKERYRKKHFPDVQMNWSSGHDKNTTKRILSAEEIKNRDDYIHETNLSRMARKERNRK